MNSITGKSFSEALILASTNPQYDKRLFIDLPLQYMKTTSSEHVVYINCFFVQNNLCTKHVLSLQFSCTELVIQCTICCHNYGLVDAKIRDSDKNLPVFVLGSRFEPAQFTSKGFLIASPAICTTSQPPGS